MRTGLIAGLVLWAGLVCAGGSAWAQDAAAQPKAATPATGAPAGGIGRGSLLRLVQQANPMLWPLVAASIVMVGYIFERTIALRRGRVLPKEFAKRFLERLGQGKLDRERAIELCKANDSPLAHVFGHAVRYWGQSAAAIRQAIDHDAASEVLELRRNVRMLNGTATIAPLLGLLGTVIGMVESFDAVGSDRGVNASRSEALAHGISLALLTTAVGLAIAIISAAFYYYFLQKIDSLARDLDEQANLVIDQIAAEAMRPATHRGPLMSGAPELAAPVEPPRPRTLGRVDTA
jgi:biopolymer transport protein ExbB